MKTTLHDLIDCINADTNIILYDKTYYKGFGYGDYKGCCRVYEYPHKHHLNCFYGYVIDSIECLGTMEMLISVKEA